VSSTYKEKFFARSYTFGIKAFILFLFLFLFSFIKINTALIFHIKISFSWITGCRVVLKFITFKVLGCRKKDKTLWAESLGWKHTHMGQHLSSCNPRTQKSLWMEQLLDKPWCLSWTFTLLLTITTKTVVTVSRQSVICIRCTGASHYCHICAPFFQAFISAHNTTFYYVSILPMTFFLWFPVMSMLCTMRSDGGWEHFLSRETISSGTNVEIIILVIRETILDLKSTVMGHENNSFTSLSD